MDKSTLSKVTAAIVASFCIALLPSCASRKNPVANNIDPRYGAEKYYKKMHEQFMERAKGAQIDLLFLGDSLTAHWLLEGKNVWDSQFDSWHPGNFGLSGDTTYGVLWRLQQTELRGLHPKVLVLLIGTNDLSVGLKPKAISESIGQIVETIKLQLPDTMVVLLGLLPREPASDPVRKQLAEVNDRISALGNGKDITYLDLGKSFVDAKGEIFPELTVDGLHLTSKGYQVFAEALRPTLAKLLPSSAPMDSQTIK